MTAACTDAAPQQGAFSGEPGVTVDKFSPIVRDAIYDARWKLYATSAYVGLS